MKTLGVLQILVGVLWLVEIIGVLAFSYQPDTFSIIIAYLVTGIVMIKYGLENLGE